MVGGKRRGWRLAGESREVGGGVMRAGVQVAAGVGLENEACGPGQGHRRALEGFTWGVVFRFTFQMATLRGTGGR